MMCDYVYFSLIVPVFNVEPYLRRCLDSIFAQEYRFFEVICVNDGSTDASGDILAEFSDTYANLTVISQYNQGLGAARNVGLKHARGEFVWFIDSDDCIESGALTVLNTVICGGRYDVVLFNYRVVSEKGSKIANNISTGEEGEFACEEYINHLLLRQARFYAWAKVFRKNSLLDSGYQFPSGWYEDVSLVKYFHAAKPSIYHTGHCLYNYFQRPGSIMRSYDLRVLDSLGVAEDLKGYFTRDPNYEGSLWVFYFSCIKSIYSKAMKIDNKDSREEVLNRLLTKEAGKIISSNILFHPQISFRNKFKCLLVKGQVIFRLYS